MEFSANLGFLWRELPLAARLEKAAEAGFTCVELHDDWAGEDHLAGNARRLGIRIIGLNAAHHGPDFGRAADPAAAATVAEDIRAAARAAKGLGAESIHLLGGKHRGAEAEAAFDAAVAQALDVWTGTVLLEPISEAAVPGYHLPDLDAALSAVARIAHPRLRILFDTYHIGMSEPDLGAAFDRAAPNVGHIQIAAVPSRTEPDRGEIDILAFLRHARASGYRGAVGVECHPEADAPRLDWLPRWRAELAGDRG